MTTNQTRSTADTTDKEMAGFSKSASAGAGKMGDDKKASKGAGKSMKSGNGGKSGKSDKK